jgi:hypothetical protein
MEVPTVNVEENEKIIDNSGLYDKVSRISSLCFNPMVKKLCNYMNSKYKEHLTIKAFCDAKSLLSVVIDDKTKGGFFPYFEIWNDTSKNEGGNAITCYITSVTQFNYSVSFDIETSVLKDETFETTHELVFETGDKGNEFNDTDGNNEFYNFLEKFDTVNEVLRT